jgi:adenylate kinase
MLGAPGVGKGSQASRLTRVLSIPHISTGDLFREQIAGNTEIGQKVSSLIDQGVLVPDEITVDLLARRLNNEDCQKGFVLDGFPRTLQQAHSLDIILKDMNINIDVVVNISLDDSSIVKRITGRLTCSSCGAVYHVDDSPPYINDVCNHCTGTLISRSDDSPFIIQNRLHIYYDQTKPLIDFYLNKVKFIHIESDKLIDVTTRKVFEALEISANIKMKDNDVYETITE